jgi:hypothetical protein
MLGLMTAPGLALAVSDNDVAAVTAYRQAVDSLGQELKAAKAEVKKAQTALTAALAKVEGYSEKEVTALHTELAAAKTKLGEVELKGLLTHKQYNPDWRPEANGRELTPWKGKGGDHHQNRAKSAKPAPPEEAPKK